jgi:hypothetical protein
MKKIALLFVALSTGVFVTASEAEGSFNLKSSSSGEKCFDENSHLINLGISFGGVGYYKYVGGTYRRSPIFNFSYEQPWKQKIGPGFLGVGAYASFQTQYYARVERSAYDWQFYNYESHWTHITVAGRAVYHWDVLNSERAEVYGGVIIGVRMNLYRYETNDPNPSKKNYELANSFAYPAWGAFVGARWYFVKNVALYAEAGHGVSNVNAGLTIKF